MPLIVLFYGIGDYLHWWDDIFGRSNALKCYARLSSNEGYPKIMIFDDETEFHGLYKFMISRVSSQPVAKLAIQGKKPNCIGRVGGTLGHELQKQLPPNWPNVRFVPETAPIVFIYSVSRKSGDNEGIVYYVSSLGDLRRWIEESKNSERFWVTTILIGFLSISLILLEFSKPNK